MVSFDGDQPRWSGWEGPSTSARRADSAVVLVPLPRAQSESDTVDYRKYLASKVYRSCCVMGSIDFKTRMLSTMFAGRPMHWLWQRLEWLDERRSGLMDARCLIASIWSPIATSELRIADPRGALLRSLRRRSRKTAAATATVAEQQMHFAAPMSLPRIARRRR